ncbi:MAG: prolipoprotein diacylglyceryl transferase [Dehalococcoidia bacterium]|jgi:phosphatidylglycerol:prolipoprotein diacylglycerol transferase|nr:prolipoprotein diacylglyceryl transferase [Dehalococcoidia bacterium]
MTPLLVIEIGFDPNIATIGGFLLSWHGLFTAVGILAGVNLALRIARVIDYDEDDAYTLALVGVPSGIIGARLLFVAEHWDFYGESPGDIIAITEGGISIWGAILGGILGSYLFALWRGYEIGSGLDIAAFGLILGQAVGRIGDVINGEHLATVTDLPWGVIYTDPNSPGFAHSVNVGAVHPAVAYELIGDLVILAVLFGVLFGVFRNRPGLTFLVYFAGYAAMRFVLTELRVDSAESLLGLRVPQVASMFALIGAIPLLIYYWNQPPVNRRREVATVGELTGEFMLRSGGRRVPARRR